MTLASPQNSIHTTLLFRHTQMFWQWKRFKHLSFSFTFHRPFIRFVVPRSSCCPMPVSLWREWIWQYNVSHCVWYVCVFERSWWFFAMLIGLEHSIVPFFFSRSSIPHSSGNRKKPPRSNVHLAKSSIFCAIITVRLN